MAEIYLARTIVAEGLSKFVIIKKVLPHLSNDKEFVSMFKEEAKLAINLNHNNLVSIIYFGCESGQHYLVMDYIEGRSLQQILAQFHKLNRAFSVDQVIYIIKDVAAGLDHAHRCVDPSTNQALHIVHRDISPQNIMLSFEGAVKVIDFGIAKADIPRANTEVGTYKGKFNYMSPEQVSGNELDGRSDVFSLGVVFWELLAKRPLFTGNSYLEVLNSVKACKIPSLRDLNPQISAELENCVLRCLKRNPTERYLAASELNRDLSRLLNSKYPNFSPQEFSQQIKSLFLSEHTAHREKLIEYTQINIENKNTVLEFTPEEIYESPNEDLPEGFGKNLAPQNALTSKTNFEFKKLAKTTAPQPFHDFADVKNYKAPASVLAENNSYLEQKAFESQRNLKRTTRSSNWPLRFLLIGLCYFGFYKYFVPYAKKSPAIRKMASAATPKILKYFGSIQLSASPEETPEKTEELFNTAKAYEQLQNLKRGFVNISLEEPELDTRILVNGHPLLEKPPLMMFPIVAEQAISVIVEDIKTKKQIHRTILVKNGETFDLNLSFKAADDAK